MENRIGITLTDLLYLKHKENQDYSEFDRTLGSRFHT